MSTYRVTLPDGTAVEVNWPARYRFDPPVSSEAQARERIAHEVAAAARPRLTGSLPQKLIKRGPDGAVDRVVDMPAFSTDVLAAAVGLQVAMTVFPEATEE